MNEDQKRGIATASKFIEQYTYPFLTVGRSNLPVVIASCVFIDIFDQFFLITAGHALRSNNHGLFTRGNGKLIDIVGNATVSRDEGRDNFDIAAIHIDPATIQGHSIQTVPSELFATSWEVKNPHSRAISGFPASMNKPAKILDRQNKTLTGKCFTYFGYAEFTGQYQKFEKTQESHIGIELLPGTDDTGKYLSTPIWPPRGISGGGAWLIPNLEIPNECFLEGIFIEGHRYAKRMFGFSTRIEHVVNFLKQTHIKQHNQGEQYASRVT
jgi:hypothetical protein